MCGIKRSVLFLLPVLAFDHSGRCIQYEYLISSSLGNVYFEWLVELSSKPGGAKSGFLGLWKPMIRHGKAIDPE